MVTTAALTPPRKVGRPRALPRMHHKGKKIQQILDRDTFSAPAAPMMADFSVEVDRGIVYDASEMVGEREETLATAVLVRQLRRTLQGFRDQEYRSTMQVLCTLESATVAEIMLRTGEDPAVIRRDLDQLQSLGLVKLLHGSGSQRSYGLIL